ncbi:hypothetical protein Tco_0355430 [Tanacetum coccineum]
MTISKQDKGDAQTMRTLTTAHIPELSTTTCDKERKIALSISKLKAARYLDFGLEEELRSFLWDMSEREYDISASMASLTDANLSGDHDKVFEKYGYNYLREIILRRADYQEYKISEKDFKNLHPNDFEDLFLLNIQEKLNHLPKTDKISLHTAVNMWMRNLMDRLTDHGKARPKVKDIHLSKLHKGKMRLGKWSEDDKRRTKLITAIEKRLQIRRIYRSLESFVGGRIRDIDYRLINRTT